MTTIKLSNLLNDSNIIFKENNGEYFSLVYDSEIRSGLDDSVITIILKKGAAMTEKDVAELD